MFRWIGLFLFAFLACPALVPAQVPRPDPPKETTPSKATVASGLRLQAVPEALYEHIQTKNLRRGLGVLVEKVDAESVAAQAGLERFDIILTVDGKGVRDAEHFLTLAEETAGKIVHVGVLRAGKETTVPAHLAPAAVVVAKGINKPGGPPAVLVDAYPHKDGQMTITFKFYSEGKQESVKCTGTLDQIREQLRSEYNMPPVVRELATAAVERIRSLNNTNTPR